MATPDDLPLPSHWLQWGGMAEAVSSTDQAGTPHSWVGPQPPKLWCRSEPPCALGGPGAGRSPALPVAAAASQTTAADPGLPLHGIGNSPVTQGATAAAQTMTADSGIPVLLEAQEGLLLPLQAQKYLLLLPGFSLLSAPSPILKQSWGRAWVP